MNLGAGQPASLPYGVEPQRWYSYHSMQFSSPLQQSDLPFSSVCYHPPPPGNYPPPLHLTQPNHYPPPHHFTPPNPYPPLLHFAEPNSYPPPPTPNPYSAYAYHPHQPSYPHTQPHFIPTNQVVPPHITHEPPAPIANLMHVEPDPPLPRLDEFMESMSRLLDDCISKCFKGMRVSEDSSPSLRDHVPVPTQMPKSQSSEPRNCSPLRQQPNTKPSPRLGDAQSLMFSTSRIEQAFGGAISATGRVKKRRDWKRNKLLMRNKSLFQSSDVPSLLGNSISAQSSINSASDFPVSDITGITNRNLMNEGCDGMSSVFVAKSGEIDENLGNWKELSFGKSVKGDGKQSDDVVVSTPAGVSIKNQMQCPDLYGNGRERYALPLLDEMPKSKVLCIVGKAVTSIRDKGGGVEHGSGVNYKEEDEYFVKSVEKDDQAGHVIIAKYEGRYETGDNLKGESLNNREGADVKAVTGNEKQVRMMSTIALLSGSSMFVSLSTIKNMGTSMPNSACPLPTKNGYHKTDGTSVKLSDQGLSLCVESVSHLFDDMLQSDWLCNTRQKIVAYMGIRDKGGGLKTEFRENAISAACLDVCEDGGNLAGNKSLCLQVPTKCGQLMQLMIMEIVPDEEDLAEGDAQHVKLSNERPEYDALQLSYKKLQLEGSVSDKREGDAKLGWLLESVIVPTGDKNFMAYFHEALQSIPCSYQDWRARLNWFSAAMIQCSINPIVFVDTILLGDIDKGVSLNYISKMEITANIVGELDEIGRWKIHITSGTTLGAGCAQEFNVEFFGRFVVLFKGSVTSPNNDVAKSYGHRGFAAQWYVQECDRLLLKVQKRGSGSMESKVASDTTLDEASIDISRGTQGFIKVVEVKDFEVDIGEQHVLDSSSVSNLVHMFSLHVAEISMTDVPNKAELQKPQQVDMSSNSFLFLPDKLGLTWLTFVDVAASTESELLECGDHKIQELMRPYVTMYSDHEGRHVSTRNSSKSVELHALQKEKDKGDIACIAGQAIVVLNVFRMHHTLSFGFLIGGGKDAEAAKKCVTTLTIPVCTPGCIPQYMDDTQYFGCSQLQVDYEGTEAQGQVMAPLMIMLIGGERCKGYYMAIRIAALRMYFFWCLLFGLNYSGSTCNVCYDRNLRTSLF